MHGASSTLIKNPSGLPVPQITLEEAGTFCVCLSSAWNSKVIQAAWWVYSNQVSKTAPTGLYLSLGSFMIRGKKNFLHPSKLEMSIVLLFKLDENSLANHIGERSVKETVQRNDSDEVELVAEEEWTISTTNFNQKTQKNPKKEKKENKQKEIKEVEIKKEEVKEIEKKKMNKPLSIQQQRKLKKIKEKYSEQTEEEKQARLKLLGSKEVKFSYVLEKHQEPDNEIIEKNEENPETVEAEKIPEKVSSDSEENEEKVEKVEKVEKETKEKTTQDFKNEKKEIQQILEDENLLGEEELKALEETDSLTGQPTLQDTLLFCLPMCAPHIATTAYKYRIKLVPGNLKKGKAVSLMTFTWLNTEPVAETEKQLIKAMNESEIITVLPGKVSIASAAAKKIQQTNKKNKK